MSRRALRTVLLSLSLLFGVASVTLLTAYAQGLQEWVTDTPFDFLRGDEVNGVDIWSDPGTARLDRGWWPNVRVNDDLTEEKWYPSLSFIPAGTAGLTQTRFLAVWEDHRNTEHCPDIYFSYSDDGGRTWKPNAMVANACDPDDPPYPDCACLWTPDLAVRKADEQVWVVWRQDPSYRDVSGDNGDIYYAHGDPDGSSWSSAAPVYEGPGDQRSPSIAPHGRSGYLYVVWEDERDDDGDIYVSRYDGSGWSDPVKVNDDATDTDQQNPAVRADDSGNVYVIWEDFREDGDYEDIYFSRWLTGTTWGTWTSNVRLSDPDADFAFHPDLAVGPGVLFATWVERKSGYFHLVVARSYDQGATWQRAIVSSIYYQFGSSFFSYESPSISSDPWGRVYVVWLRGNGNNSDILFSMSPDGGQHWTRPRVLDDSSASVVEVSHPHKRVNIPIAVDFDGKVVAAWYDCRDDPNNPQIYATGYPADSYLTQGQYVRTLDAHGPASWGTITWTATVSPGTGLQIATRVMTAPGANWTGWYTYTHPGQTIPHPSGQLIQYRAVFTSTGADTAVLDKVIISYEQYRVFLPMVMRQ